MHGCLISMLLPDIANRVSCCSMHRLLLLVARGLHMISALDVGRRKLLCLSASPVGASSHLSTSWSAHHHAWVGQFGGSTRCLRKVRLRSGSRELNHRRRFRSDNLRRRCLLFVDPCFVRLRLSTHLICFYLHLLNGYVRPIVASNYPYTLLWHSFLLLRCLAAYLIRC